MKADVRSNRRGCGRGVCGFAIGIAAAGVVALSGVSASAHAGGDVIIPQPASGDPLLELTQDELDRFWSGRDAFNHTLTEAEGLGPVFNKESCGNCHASPIGGPGSQTVIRFGAFDKKGGFDPMEDWGGSLLQQSAISEECAEEVPDSAGVTAERVTPGALGYGLIEAIPDADILALESGGPGVSGKAHMVEPFEFPGEQRVGRFGWKAQVATVLTFSADASLNEMGLTNRFLQEENDPNGIFPPELEDCDTVPDPEDHPGLGGTEGVEFIDTVTDFQRFVAAPPQTPKSGMTGEAVFNNIGCNQCHTAQFTTADDPGLEDALRNKVIRPYSDFLLHDMGQAADFIPQGAASAQEIRTPPLWGLRFRDPIWHDGRFAGGSFEQRITDAILEHGAFLSEGADSAAAFQSLTQVEKDQLIQFLDSLGRREFDHDGDGEVDLQDFFAFQDCFESGPVSPDDPCAISDINQDSAVDLDDFESFLLVYTGPAEDCNDNGVIDIEDILVGTSVDTDGNGVPDECVDCPADIAGGDGMVGTSDLLELLANWGTDGPGAAIAEPTDVVDTADLLSLLSSWGSCSG